MNDYSTVEYWKTKPNRDQALERVYKFLQAFGSEEFHGELNQVIIKDIGQLRKILSDALHHYLHLAIEDTEWEIFEGKDLSFEIDDPFETDEDLIYPEFSGTEFEMKKDETLSVKIGLHGYITPIRLHFIVVEADELFYLRLHRITAKDDE